MSIQALTWVIYGVAPDIKHADFRTLLVLADHADPQGMGAYPSRSTISRLTGYSVRTVSYALKSLESSGLISRGDQRIVSGLGGYKPTVWNLNMSRGAKTAPLKNAETPVQHDCTPAVQTDCTPAVQAGVQKTRTGVQTGVQHDCTRTISKEEPYIEPRESNARARKQIPIPADWKPSEEHRTLADRLGIDCSIEADKFRDRALESGAGFEDPAEICREMAGYIGESHHRFIILPDRAAAVERSIAELAPGEILILAGKGEEDYQKVQGRYDFYESDLAIARRCLGL